VSRLHYTAYLADFDWFLSIALSIPCYKQSLELLRRQTYKASLYSKKQHKNWATALMVATLTDRLGTAAVTTHHMAPSPFPTPMNTSTLTGMESLRELPTGDPWAGIVIL
jgi:hypothetical protein